MEELKDIFLAICDVSPDSRRQPTTISGQRPEKECLTKRMRSHNTATTV
jgi:hypothetical protein